MQINNTSGVSNVGNTQAVGNQQATKRTSSLPPPPDGAAATTQVSTRGELMAKLSELAQKDPAKLKQVLSSIADSLKQADAQGQGNGNLGKLADRFAQAAQTGDISTLAPRGPSGGGPAGAHGHHHHHDHDGDSGQHGGALQGVFANALSQINDALSATAAPTVAATPASESTASSETQQA